MSCQFCELSNVHPVVGQSDDGREQKIQVEPVLFDNGRQKLMRVLPIGDFGLDINRAHHQYTAYQQLLMPRDGLIKE